MPKLSAMLVYLNIPKRQAQAMGQLCSSVVKRQKVKYSEAVVQDVTQDQCWGVVNYM